MSIREWRSLSIALAHERRAASQALRDSTRRIKRAARMMAAGRTG